MRFQGGEIMSMLNFGVNSISFYISALFYLLAYTLMSFPKCSLNIFSKVLMFSKDLLKFHYVKISYVACAYLLA
jgi:hypothetical protein